MTDVIQNAVSAAWSQLPDGVADAFSSDPESTLRDALGLKTVAVSTLDVVRQEGGACDGVSYLDDGVILYRPTQSRRQFFTLAHELGHWLVDQTDDVYDLLANQRESAKLLETVCDRIAQRLLLPAALIDSVLSGSPPAARHVTELMDASLASRPVCGIALASRLRGLGAVIISDPERAQVDYVSVRPDSVDGWPAVFPWTGQPIPPGHPIQQVRGDHPITRKSYWETPWGARADYYIGVVADGDRAIGVLSDRDLWGSEQLHLDAEREFDRRPLGEVRCCGATRSVRGWPCATCGEQCCPTCGKCRCDRQAAREVRCTMCGCQYLPHLVTGGVCVDCR
jgi:hypothetical protein